MRNNKQVGKRELTKMTQPPPQDGKITLHEAENLSFGSSNPHHLGGRYDLSSDVNGAIVDTFLRLPPSEILRLAAGSRFAYSRDRLVREVRLAHPDILEDRQSLGPALAAVLGERQPARFLTEHYGSANHGALFAAQGGILDYEVVVGMGGGVDSDGDEDGDGVLRGAMDVVDVRQRVRDWVRGGGGGGGGGFRMPLTMGRGRLAP